MEVKFHFESGVWLLLPVRVFRVFLLLGTFNAGKKLSVDFYSFIMTIKSSA